MSIRRDDADSEDLFADTRMTFGEHLEDLRRHLLRAIYGFLIALCFSFFIGKTVLHIISKPVTDQLEAFYMAHAKQVVEDLPSDPRLQRANKPRWVRMSFLRKLQEPPRQEARPALPDNGQPVPFVDLAERIHIDVADAGDAVEAGKWERVTAAAGDLAAVAERLPAATEVPDSYGKKYTTSLAKELGDATAELRAAAEERNSVRARAALYLIGHRVPLDDVADDRLVSRWVRIDEPLLFSEAINDGLSQVQDRFGLATLSIQEALMAYFKVSVVCGLVIGSPWILYQIWLFVAAGLYPHEKRLVNVYGPMSFVLFVSGVFICQVFVIPKAIEALLWFNEWVGMKPELRFNEWLGFAILMPVVFGVSFQLPLVMLFLERIGVLTVEVYLGQWKIALFLIHVFAAIITPSVDLISLELLAMPMFGLYGLGIMLCKLRPRRADLDIEVPDSEEPVGV